MLCRDVVCNGPFHQSHNACTLHACVFFCMCMGVGLCRSGSGLQQSLLVTESVGDTSTEWLEYVDPNEPRYCLCNQVSTTTHPIPLLTHYNKHTQTNLCTCSSERFNTVKIILMTLSS